MFFRSCSFLISIGLCSMGMALEVSVYSTDASCGLNNGTATASLDTLNGGEAPFAYLWSPSPATGQGTYNVTGLAPGDYSVVVTDANGLTATETFTIQGFPNLFPDDTIVPMVTSCFTDCNGSMGLWDGIIGGTGPYSGTVDQPGASVFVYWGGIGVSGLCEGGPYNVTVTDALGCTAQLVVEEVEIFDQVQLLGQSVTASCPNGSTGTAQLLFDRPVTLTNYDTWQPLSMDSVSYHDLSGLPPGPLNILAIGFLTPCPDSVSVSLVIPSSSNNCGSISGTIFVDLNGDCIQDPGEFGLPNRTLQFSTQDLAITDANGNYTRDLPLGEHDLSFSMPNYSPICPAMPFTFDLTTSDPMVQQDIAMQFNGGGPDVFVELIASQAKPGYSAWVSVSVVNNSPYTFTGLELQLQHSILQTLDPNDTSSVATVIGPGLISWQIPSIAPISTQQFWQALVLPADPALIGTQIDYSAQLIQPVPDNDPSNDSDQQSITVVGAYDPNDKLAITSTQGFPDIYSLNFDQYVDYTIRFQNTGNAEAEHVFLDDTISDLFDASTLEILGASHSYEVDWLEDRSIRFDFPQIMLPDSTTDPVGSQGFVSFRLYPVQAIIPGDLLLNAADIYFDFNPPIRTNTTELLVELTESIEENAETSIGSFPNPTSHQITIEATDLGQFIWAITSTDGKNVLAGRNAAQERSIDVSSLAKGQYILQVIGSDRTGYAKFIKQ